MATTPQPLPPQPPRRVSCGSLLQELQELWGEIGQDEMERDRMILQLEEDCLNVYRKQVDQTKKQKAGLLQALSVGEADIDKILCALGERETFPRSEKLGGTLLEQLAKTEPVLEDLRHRRDERVNEFRAVQMQIIRLQAEISGAIDHGDANAPMVDENDLSLKRLGELKAQLNELQTEKNLRLQKIDTKINCIHEMCNIMSLDLKKALHDVHPTYSELGRSQTISISNSTIKRLEGKVDELNNGKKQRLRKLQDLGSTLIELWNLMDTPVDEQRHFDHVTSLIKVSPNTVMPQGCLAHDLIEKVENEVKRLTYLRASKMKELVFKKMTELEEIYRSVHMDNDSNFERRILNDIDSGRADLSELLTSMDVRIEEAKELALSRRDILDKANKWKTASEEETWLDGYERDQNRYNAGRGAHVNLMRAEKARILVSKLPNLLDNLTAKVKDWEREKDIPFMFDKVRLLDSLEKYTSTRQQKEKEKRHSREQKKHQEQFAVEQGSKFGTKPSPICPLPARKPLGQSSNVNIVGGTPTSRRVSTPVLRKGGLSSGKVKEPVKTTVAPANYVALPKDCSNNSSP
ncbi:hypothetical protein BS78_09G142600 [Paspalum vaginatum]|nr:hypothetical protein BS78_09G142600 [Paspalum vaginatum]